MSENNNVMTTITKNPVVIIGIVVVIIGAIALFVKMRGSEEAFSASNLFDDTFDTSDTSDTSDTFENIVENFPQSTPMNVMYSDAAGNLGTTTDLGLQNLTVKGGSNLNGNVLSGDVFGGGSQVKTETIVAGPAYGGRLHLLGDNVYVMAKNGVRIATDPNSSNPWGASNGNLAVDGTISTSTGYAMFDNRNVKPNELSSNKVQFGFGSLANNGDSPWADTIHLNGWGDRSGGNPNLVMFDKSKPGMRIYQGNWNSEAYTTYNDAVMADSGGNASIGGNLNVNGKVLEKGHALIPYGMIMMWAGAVSQIPAGWVLCDGGNGTPNLRDRFIVGAGSGYGVGATGGANEVQLLKRHMPRHSHKSANTSNQIAGHGWPTRVAGGNQNSIDTNGVVTSFNDLISEEGEDVPHENRPPYYALCYIMKV
jgi:hypothetical protein